MVIELNILNFLTFLHIHLETIKQFFSNNAKFIAQLNYNDFHNRFIH